MSISTRAGAVVAALSVGLAGVYGPAVSDNHDPSSGAIGGTDLGALHHSRQIERGDIFVVPDLEKGTQPITALLARDLEVKRRNPEAPENSHVVYPKGSPVTIVPGGSVKVLGSDQHFGVLVEYTKPPPHDYPTIYGGAAPSGSLFFIQADDLLGWRDPQASKVRGEEFDRAVASILRQEDDSLPATLTPVQLLATAPAKPSDVYDQPVNFSTREFVIEGSLIKLNGIDYRTPINADLSRVETGAWYAFEVPVGGQIKRLHALSAQTIPEGRNLLLTGRLGRLGDGEPYFAVTGVFDRARPPE